MKSKVRGYDTVQVEDNHDDHDHDHEEEENTTAVENNSENNESVENVTE